MRGTSCYSLLPVEQKKYAERGGKKKKNKNEAVGMDCSRYIFLHIGCGGKAGKKRTLFSSIYRKEKEWSLTRTIVVRKRNLWHNFYITISSAFLSIFFLSLISLPLLIDIIYSSMRYVCGHPMDGSKRSMWMECQLLINVFLFVCFSRTSLDYDNTWIKEIFHG